MNCSGPRVDYPKGHGLFSKFSRPNRYLQIRTVGSRSGGLDPYGTRSDRGRPCGIGRPGQAGRAGRRRRMPATLLRGGASPEYAELGRPGLDSTRAWPGSFNATWVNHLGPWFGATVSGARCAAPGAALRRRGSPESHAGAIPCAALGANGAGSMCATGRT